MTTNEEVKIAENHLAGLEREITGKLAELDACITEAEEKHGRGVLLAGAVESLKEERKSRAAAYVGILQAARGKVELARAAARAQDAEKETKRAQAEEAEKARALALWVKAGGAAADFETSWPTIRARQLETAVLEKPKQVNRRGRITL